MIFRSRFDRLLPTIALMFGSLHPLSAGAEAATPPPGWPAAVREIKYPSAADTTLQPALYYAPRSDEPKPLLVALHTWSSTYLKETGAPYAEWCIANGWVFIHPDFRGVNNRPEAAGSELAVQDVLSAVAFARQQANVDGSRIYLAGVSGGGHMALLMAGRAPELWAGVSAWAAITDLKAWYAECRQRKLGYADDIVRIVGGIPGESAAADRECARRSPLSHLAAAKNLPLDINAGIMDGHTGSVPIRHSLHAFNLLAADRDRLTAEQIATLVEQAKVPPSLAGNYGDATYRAKPVLFRRQSGATRVTVFNGDHEIIFEASLRWLAQQRKR